MFIHAFPTCPTKLSATYAPDFGGALHKHCAKNINDSRTKSCKGKKIKLEERSEEEEEGVRRWEQRQSIHIHRINQSFQSCATLPPSNGVSTTREKKKTVNTLRPRANK